MFCVNQFDYRNMRMTVLKVSKCVEKISNVSKISNAVAFPDLTKKDLTLHLFHNKVLIVDFSIRNGCALIARSSTTRHSKVILDRHISTLQTAIEVADVKKGRNGFPFQFGNHFYIY